MGRSCVWAKAVGGAHHTSLGEKCRAPVATLVHCLATSTRFLAIDKGQVQASLAGRNAGVCGCFALASLHVPMQSTLVDPQDSSHLNTGELVPYLYLSLEGDRPWAGGLRVCLAGVHAVHVGRGTERSVSRKTSGGTTVVRINVADDRMSREHLVVERTLGAWGLRDAGSSNGTFVGTARVDRSAVVDGTVVGVGRTVFVFREHRVDTAKDQSDLDFSSLSALAPGLRTLSPSLATEFSRVVQFATTDIDILVLGETGTGKELVAGAVHKASRRTGDFVAVNCGALTDTLVESQLFGYQKGAFSGATENRPGLIRSADKGTLFLDEIGDLPMPSQAAFLRVLQERAVTPVGGTRPIPFDAKLIAATHCPLEDMVERQEFRADLLARVRGFILRLPSLAERLEDLGGIVAGIFHAKDSSSTPRISLSAGMALFTHAWPQNIRELGRTLEMSRILAGDGEIAHEHLPEYMRSAPAKAPTSPATSHVSLPTIDEASEIAGDESDMARREQLIACLRKHEGNVSAVARDMGKARNQIQRWIKRYELDASTYRY